MGLTGCHNSGPVCGRVTERAPGLLISLVVDPTAISRVSGSAADESRNDDPSIAAATPARDGHTSRKSSLPAPSLDEGATRL